MLSGWWTAVLLLLPAVTQTLSGDGDADSEPRTSCTSHITTHRSSLTCKLVGGDNEDDEDGAADVIEKMSMCYIADWSTKRTMCVEELGDTIIGELSSLVDYSVTVHLKGGRKISTIVDLKKIIKPRSPQVKNVIFDQESNQAVIHIWTPYHHEYLKVDNQLFQLLIWTAGSTTIQNISSSDTMSIDMEHLQKNSEYHIKVRAIPYKHLQGTWSEWSATFTFCTPAEEKVQKLTDERRETYKLIVCLVILVLVSSGVVFFLKNKIFTYMWPSIPQPKHTLVQICKPNNGLLLNFKPEVFSALKVSPVEKTEEPSLTDDDDGTQSHHRSSTRSSDCSRSTTSISTEELEVSTLLSRSSSDGEDSLRSAGPSSIDVLRLWERPRTPRPGRSGGGTEVEVFGVNQQEEAYVTMSSFYQIK